MILNVVTTQIDNKISQGLIFPGAVAEDYIDCIVYGLIITARCDIAHNKADKFNYLPIVNLSDWLKYDFKKIILPLIEKEIVGQFKNILKELKHSVSILDTTHPSKVYEVLVKDDAPNKIAQRYKDNLTNYQSLEVAQKNNNKDLPVDLINRYQKQRDDIITRLIQNNLNGFYFIPAIDCSGKNSGYVILLREIRHLPRNLAYMISNGLAKDAYECYSIKNKDSACNLTYNVIDYIYPISQMLSPYIEHLMQLFCNTFGRIGIADISNEYINKTIASNFIDNMEG